MGKKVLFSGYYGFDNSGDDAILHAIVADIRACDPTVQLNVLSYDPPRTRRLYGVNATQRFHYKSVKKALMGTDLLISGAGLSSRTRLLPGVCITTWASWPWPSAWAKRSTSTPTASAPFTNP